MTRELGPIFVAADQDDRSDLVRGLLSNNVPAIRAGSHMPVDLMWTRDGQPVMWDMKKIKDFIDSYLDGRLHDQITAMQEAGCWLFGLILELEKGTRSPNGVNCGGEHGWDWEGFDDAVLDVQQFGGVKIVESFDPSKTARRIAAAYRWTGKDRAAGWHSPVPIEAYNDFRHKDPNHPNGIIFFDETYRGQVGALMHLPGCGLVKANDLREHFSFMETLGITEEGLTEAIGRWKSLKGIGTKTVAEWEAWIRS